MDPRAIAEKALRDEQELISYHRSKMLSLDGKICSSLPDIERSVRDRIQLLDTADNYLEKNLEWKVSGHSRERSLYFQLRKERNGKIELAWIHFLDWQRIRCQQDSGLLGPILRLFGEDEEDKKESWNQSLEQLNRSILALRLALFRYLSRLSPEDRRTVLSSGS